MSDTPLGSFLRARRRRLAPADAGLPAGARRRTPGLRREEVAARAGISADYYARLEQGRQRVPTGPVLDGLAEALLLADAERAYLHRLARHPGGAPSAADQVDTVTAATRALLGTLDETPAFVVGPRFDLLAWNPLAGLLIGDLDARPAYQRNLLWQVFCCPFGASSPANRDLADSIGADLVAGLRAHHADRPGDHALGRLVARLSADSAEFATLWAQHRAVAPRQGVLWVRHPELDTGTFEYTVLALPEPGQHLFVYLAPPGSRAREAFRALRDTVDVLAESGAP